MAKLLERIEREGLLIIYSEQFGTVFHIMNDLLQPNVRVIEAPS